MNYSVHGIREGKTPVSLGVWTLEQLDGVLQAKKKLYDQFHISADLSVNFIAEVLRENPMTDKEIVHLVSGTCDTRLVRDTDKNPGDLGVSCDPKGRRVTVKSIDIPFQPINDTFTDRGMVWVFPGAPATLLVVLKKKCLEQPGRSTTLLELAYKQVRQRLLGYLEKAS